MQDGESRKEKHNVEQSDEAKEKRHIHSCFIAYLFLHDSSINTYGTVLLAYKAVKREGWYGQRL